MRSPLRRHVLTVAVCALLLDACSGSHASPPAQQAVFDAGADVRAPDAAQATMRAGDTTPSRARAASLTRRTVIDRQQAGIVAAAFLAPANWTDRSAITWRYMDISRPMTMQLAVQDSASVAGYFGYPALDLFWIPGQRIYHPGQHTGGLIFAAPMAPVATLQEFVRETRANVQQLVFVDARAEAATKPSPELPPHANQQAVTVRVRYVLDQRPVEEEFHATWYAFMATYNNPHGRVSQQDWGLKAPSSQRAAAGELDAMRPVFRAIAQSFQVNPAWLGRVREVDQMLAQRFDATIRQDFADIDAAGARGRQIVAQSNAFLARIDQQIVAGRNASVATGGQGRSQADLQDDYIRGVETTDDPNTGTSQHSLLQSYHWTDGNGQYRNSNDANYNPNHSENGSWTLMPAASQ